MRNLFVFKFNRMLTYNKWIFLFGIILIANCSYSQTYSVTYTCLYNNNPDIQNSQPVNSNRDTILESVKPLLFTEIGITYNIVTDGKYMIVNGRIDSSSANFLLSPSDEDEVVVTDMRNRLIYYPKKKVVIKVKEYSLLNEASVFDECLNKLIDGKGNNYNIKLCKKIPSIITPPVLFNNPAYGVKSIKAPGLKVELVNYKQINEDKRLMDCKKYFDKKSNSEKEYDFFSQ